MVFPAVKVIPYFIFGYPYFGFFDMLHDRRNDFPVVPLVRLMPFLYPKAAVFLIEPCADLLFLPLFQMSELLICS